MRFNHSAKGILLPYQRAWLEDTSRWKIWLASRQIGKSLAAACEVVQECHLRPNSLWLVLSTGERQAIEFMEKVHQWTQALGLDLARGLNPGDRGAPLVKSAEVRFANNSRVIALPANPDTARGYSANLVLDEFAFHQDSVAIWRAMLPSVTNPLRGELKVRVLSTPNGLGNAFYSLWTDGAQRPSPPAAPGGRGESAGAGPALHSPSAGAGEWSRHRTTIHDAVAAGLPVEVEDLRRRLNDPDGWAQEYECQFIDAASVLLPYELIQSCESAEATEDLEVFRSAIDTQRDASESDVGVQARPARGPCYLGIDIGRKNDLTVMWLLEAVGDVLWTRGLKVLEQAPFYAQLEVARELLRDQRLPIRRCCVDATGLGAMLAEELAREHGGRVEACQFTAPLKLEIYPLLRRKLEDRLVRLPISHVVREDLHGLQKVSSATGQLQFVAPRSDDGHCDRATALALAVRAASRPPPAMVVWAMPRAWREAQRLRERRGLRG
jgi:phage FluMu gp28-like protein